MNRFLVLVGVVALLATTVPAQFLVANYAFSQSSGTYAPHTGATPLTTSSATLDDGYAVVSLGFSFAFNGTAYTQVRFGTNGWIQFGGVGTVGGNYTPISAATSTANANYVAAFARDLQGLVGTSTMTAVQSGAAGSRVASLQWAAFRRYAASSNAADNYNFQINLYEGTNVVEVVYGAMASGTTATTVQVGLRGAASTDFNNRSVPTGGSWATSVAGTVNTATCAVAPATLPASGTTFRWTPPVITYLTLSGGATPSTFSSGTNVLLTAQVGINPVGTPFSGTAVTVNFGSVGGPTAQPMYDDGTNGDATAGDNIFSYAITLTSTVAGTASFPVSASASGGLTATGTISVSIYLLANDMPSGAVPVSNGVNGPFDSTGTLLANANTMCVNASRDLWYSWTATCTGSASFSTCYGSSTLPAGYVSDTVLAVRDTALNTLDCNDDGGTTSGPGGTNICGPSGYQSTVANLPVTAGTTYLIQVSGWGSSPTPGLFTLTITPRTAAKGVVGTGCNGVGLDGTLPILGQPGTMTLTGAEPSVMGLLAVAFPAAAPLPFGGCTLYLEQETIGLYSVFTTDATGGYTLTETMPSDPAMNCLTIMTQAFVFGTVLSASNGLRLTFGT